MMSVLRQESVGYQLYTVIFLGIVDQDRVCRNKNFGDYLSDIDLSFYGKLMVFGCFSENRLPQVKDERNHIVGNEMGYQVSVIWPLLKLIASQIQYYFGHHVLQINSCSLGFANVALNGLFSFRFTEFWDLLGGIGVVLSTFWSLLGHRKSSI